MKIFFATAQGKYELPYTNNSHLSLREFCYLFRIPFQSVSFYSTVDSSQQLILGLDRTLASIAKTTNSMIIQPDRNINYPGLLLKKTITEHECINRIAEYTFPSESSTDELLHVQMTQQQCQDYTANEVGKFIDDLPDFDFDRKIVLGISGGGDSNTLLRSFLAHPKIKRENLLAVMMLGVPDWDLGKPRAIELSERYGVELRFVESAEVASLFGKKGHDWIGDFERTFPDADVETIGTLGIRLSLIHVARQVSAQAIVLGLNLEDLLAESYLCTLSGRLPKPFPVRTVDRMNIWYPLYNCPKKILDGCYPKFSLKNYDERYPSVMLGRAVPYHLAQMTHTILPGAEFDLIRGFQKISQLNKNYAHYDDQLGFSTTEPLPLDIRTKWEGFLGK